MKHDTKDTARLAGFFYLLMLVFGGFAEWNRQTLFVTGDMVATANHIMENQFQYRFAFVCDLIMMTSFVVVPLFLYKLLASVQKRMATVMVILGISSQSAWCNASGRRLWHVS